MKNQKIPFLLNTNNEARNIIRQMDFCGTWVDADYLLAKRYNPQLKPLYFNYYTKELMHFDKMPVQAINYNNLLLGNSGAPTNNHIEALKYLYKIKYKGEIVCPLSYSGSESYVQNVCSLGAKLFGSKFTPLIEFMPLNEYQEIINRCGIVWMNHKRQQAAGNLLFLFMAQKIVVTDKNSPLNITFNNWGLTFFDKSILNKLQTVSDIDLKHNRDIILQKVSISENEAFFKVTNDI